MAFSNGRRKRVRARCAEAQGNRCCYCKRPFTPDGKARLTLEHRTPKMDGGKDRIDNCRAACLACNQSRGTQMNRARQRKAHALAIAAKATLATHPPPR